MLASVSQVTSRSVSRHCCLLVSNTESCRGLFWCNEHRLCHLCLKLVPLLWTSRPYLLGEALKELLHVGSQVSVQAAEGPRHAPDHLQGQAVELGQLVEEQRVHGPVRKEGQIDSVWMMKTLLASSLPVRVGHHLLLVTQTRLVTNLLVVEQLVQPLPDQVPRARQEVSEGAEWLVDQCPHPLLLNKESSDVDVTVKLMAMTSRPSYHAISTYAAIYLQTPARVASCLDLGAMNLLFSIHCSKAKSRPY